MIRRAANDDDEDDGSDALDDRPTLVAVARFARMVPALNWFVSVGEQPDPDIIDSANAYLEALGFPEASALPAADWLEAEEAARNTDWNTAGWEAEEQLRMALVAEACTLMDEDELMVALAHVTSQASDAVHGAAAAAVARGGIVDAALVRALAGAASQAAYQAALVLAADAGDEHPFAIKFRIFEAGHWPIGLVGNTFTIF